MPEFSSQALETLEMLNLCGCGHPRSSHALGPHDFGENHYIGCNWPRTPLVRRKDGMRGERYVVDCRCYLPQSEIP